MNIDLRKKAKNDFFKLMNNVVFGKTIKYVTKNRNIHNRKKKKLFGVRTIKT